MRCWKIIRNLYQDGRYLPRYEISIFWYFVIKIVLTYCKKNSSCDRKMCEITVIIYLNRSEWLNWSGRLAVTLKGLVQFQNEINSRPLFIFLSQK